MKFDGFKISSWDEAAHAAVADDDEKDWEIYTKIVTRIGADALTQSNFEYVGEKLKEVDSEGCSHKVIRHRHWTVSWYEYYIYDPKNESIVNLLNSISEDYDQYQCLDEDRFSRLQYEYGELDMESDDYCPGNNEGDD